MDNFQLENKDSIQIKASNALRKAILRGDFAPGEKLVQDQLAKHLGISRMPIREALKQLEIEGLVRIEPYRGAFVNEIDIDAIEENYVLRSKMEKLALEKAYPHITEEDLKELDALIEKMDRTSEPEEFIQLNIVFHRELMKRCQWERLATFIQVLWNGYSQQTPEFLHGQMEHSNDEHKKITQALKAHHSEEAADLLHDHIYYTGKRLISYVESSGNK